MQRYAMGKTAIYGPNPTLMSPTAKSPCMAVTGISVKEGSQFYEAVIVTKSMHGISTAPCQIGFSLSDTDEFD